MNLTYIGQVIFYIGIVIGITCASKLPQGDSSWPDTLNIFIIAAVIAAVGLILWRKGQSEAGSTKADVVEGHPLTLLSELRIAGEKCMEALERPQEALQQDIQYLLEKYLIPITSQQQILYRELGMEKAAHILITLSYVQRMLHRSQSAYADKHQEESRSSLQEALEGLLELENA